MQFAGTPKVSGKIVDSESSNSNTITSFPPL